MHSSLEVENLEFQIQDVLVKFHNTVVPAKLHHAKLHQVSKLPQFFGPVQWCNLETWRKNSFRSKFFKSVVIRHLLIVRPKAILFILFCRKKLHYSCLSLPTWRFSSRFWNHFFISISHIFVIFKLKISTGIKPTNSYEFLSFASKLD